MVVSTSPLALHTIHSLPTTQLPPTIRLFLPTPSLSTSPISPSLTTSQAPFEASFPTQTSPEEWLPLPTSPQNRAKNFSDASHAGQYNAPLPLNMAPAKSPLVQIYIALKLNFLIFFYFQSREYNYLRVYVSLWFCIEVRGCMFNATAIMTSQPSWFDALLNHMKTISTIFCI